MEQGKEDLIAKYKARLEGQFAAKGEAAARKVAKESALSTNYLEFKKELLPKHLSTYERLCNVSGRLLRIKPDKKQSESLWSYINLCHLNTTPSGTFSFAILSFLAVFVSVTLVGFLLFRSMFFIVYGLAVGAVVMVGFMKLPEFFANNWRLKASNQMVQAIFYVSTYMRHTSNLELAVMFASDHLAPPLSLDLKKVLWDVETHKYGTIKESLDNYLETWKDWNTEFIEAFHLIEGSLFEPSDDRRLSMVDKAMNVMLEETYEKMLRYAHDLKGPVTMLYMLGIILPVLGLVILPLVASFFTSNSSPTTLAMYIALIYNVTLPLLIFYLGKLVLAKRPTGYGDTDISEENPELRKYRNIIIRLNGREAVIRPLYVSLFIFVMLMVVGLIPVLARVVIPSEALAAESVYDEKFQLRFLDYRKPNVASSDELIGPYGIGAAVLSLLIPLAIGISVGLYYKVKSSKVIRIRDNTKRLEDEFASALFQLGNRMGDGLPAEVAFGKVAENARNSVAGDFFRIVSSNLSRRGLSLRDAIYHPSVGAIIFFPSSLIDSTMKVLIESSKKGPLVASQALINISEYIKQIHRVNERLKDLMADIISDMKQQTHVLAPAIAGIVVGITSMVVTILGRLGESIKQLPAGETSSSSQYQGLIGLFGDGIPTYYFQIIVGIYLVEMIYILTILTNGIENGADRLSEESNIGSNMIRSTLIYTVISLTVIVLFNTIAIVIMSGLQVGVS